MGLSETPRFLDGGESELFTVIVLVALMRKKNTSFFNVGGNTSFYSYSYRYENEYGSFSGSDGFEP